MPITIADVAARAKVSKTTVSRVLNGKGELDESTAARVRAVIDELGYVPSSRAALPPSHPDKCRFNGVGTLPLPGVYRHET